MKVVVFIIISVIALGLTFYFSLKQKIKCPMCQSSDIAPTGKKKYSESSPGLVSMVGSPSSYHEYEFKCRKCGHEFWERGKASIVN